MRRFHLSLTAALACVVAIVDAPLHAALIVNFDADSYASTGPAGNWTDSVDGSTALVVGEPHVVKDFVGFRYVKFNGDDHFDAVEPIAGLNQWSQTVVFRTDSTGANGQDDFWRNSGLLGIDLAGSSRGDWSVGIQVTEEINSGWGNPDRGTGGPFVGNSWVIATASMDWVNNVGMIHVSSMAIDGHFHGLAEEVVQRTDMGNGTGGVEVNTFGLGYILGANTHFRGDIADIQIHDTLMTEGEIFDLHLQLASQFVPEPASVALFLTGLLSFLGFSLRRRRRLR